MTIDRRQLLIAGGATVATALTNNLTAADTNDDAAAFIKDHVAKLQPLEVA